MSVTIIGAGQVGVVSLFGKVNDNEIKSGFNLINPLASVNKMSVRTEEYTMSKAGTEGKKAGDDSISALTKEGLTVSMDVTAFYHLEESKASDLYREVGLTYEEKIIRPEIRSAIREMVAQYEAKDIYSDKRSEAAKNILTYLNNKVRERGIVIEDMLIRDVTLPANLSQAIQEKLKAEQESQRYDFVLDKEKKEAERKVIEAQGQRDAQKIIDESLSAKYLDYLYINGLKDRQGTIYVPMNPSTGMPMFKGIE
jgi:regulator of protease activity HflC (stomatin/prohibitin superfamily)